ncbi:MAG: 23S rRNA (uracil(1939)-C(5))-methyltransferase RlmD, partial [Clostridiales bacterium]|nr:23S rRNA (uracil(1939)-C(5))-methyltransferase RlmD [Clostridiales bacterium]
MKVNDIIELEIADIGCNFEGVARSEGAVVFVPFADCGERIRAKIGHINKKYAFAEAEDILCASEYRVKSPCVYYGVCGGCDALHLKYERQLEHKEKILKDTFSKLLDISKINFLPINRGEKQFSYRNKLQIPVSKDARGKTVIGFFEKNSHKIVNIEKCLLHGEWAEKVVRAVREYMEKFHIPAYEEKNNSGIIRHIVAREINGHVSVLIVINGNSLPEYSKLIKILEYSVEDFSLHISVNTKKTNVILGDNIRTLYGRERVAYTASGINANVSPLSFMQVNDSVRELIYKGVIELSKDSGVIIDAYSGGGLLTAFLSKNAEKVYGIEIMENAVSDADELMRQNGIGNVTNILGDASKILP